MIEGRILVGLCGERRSSRIGPGERQGGGGGLEKSKHVENQVVAQRPTIHPLPSLSQRYSRVRTASSDPTQRPDSCQTQAQHSLDWTGPRFTGCGGRLDSTVGKLSTAFAAMHPPLE